MRSRAELHRATAVLSPKSHSEGHRAAAAAAHSGWRNERGVEGRGREREKERRREEEKGREDQGGREESKGIE